MVLHECFTRYRGWSYLFKDTKDIEQYNRKAKKAYDSAIKNGQIEDITYPYHEFQGDLGELFSLALFRIMNNARFSIYNVKKVKNDNGIDQEGVYFNKENGKELWCPLQVKWTDNSIKELTSSGNGLSSFSEEVHNVMIEKKMQNFDEDGDLTFQPVIVTYAKGLHPYTSSVKMRGTKPLVYGHEALKQECSHPKFWRGCYEYIGEKERI